MTIVLNGERTDLPRALSVRALVARLGLDPEARGVAVAVGAEVVPRAEWDARLLAEGDRVEVLTAMQGG